MQSSLLLLGFASLVLYCVFIVIHRLFFHPLSDFPGPKLAAATKWYEFYHDIIKGRGLFAAEIRKMHQIYGPVVRVNPDELHVDDPDWYNTLYANNPTRRDKWPPAAKMAGTAHAGFGTVDHYLHGKRRAALSPLFSSRAIADADGVLQEQVHILSNALERRFASGEVVELRNLFVAFTSDTIHQYTMGESMGLQRDEQGARQWWLAMDSVSKTTPIAKQFPWMLAFGLKMPLRLIHMLRPEMTGLMQLHRKFLIWCVNEFHATATNLRALTAIENAVVKESLRISAVVTSRLPVMAHEELKYREWVIPRRTPISLTPHDVLLDARIFTKPDEFDPDRWIRNADLDRYLVAFGKGTRMCQGMRFALAELRLALATVFRRFDLELYETTKERDVDYAGIISKFRPDLEFYESTYKDFHRHPELSEQEKCTSAIAARHLKSYGFFVHEHIGGYGVIGVLKNGPGPTVLLRADMDALPVLENTGLSYASKKEMKDQYGHTVPVMHACGHDVHTTCLMAAAELLHAARSEWKGTLICLFQPAEEFAAGAQAMVDDGLYSKFGIPKPEIVLGQHVFCLYKAGTVALTAGPVFAAADGVSIRVFGKGGHGSMPEDCIDPIVTASHIVVRLQSIVSRELQPGKLGVITCGKFQAGTASNIIPDYADLELTVRSYDTKIQKQLLDAIERIVRAECDASGSPPPPKLTYFSHAPATVNDADSTKILDTSFATFFGGNAGPFEPIPGSEDFSVLARAINVPSIFWILGGCESAKWDDANKRGALKEIPINHSAGFAPVIEPTLKTGMDALALAALTFLGH
ncbi:MAG: hypothetical protein Q9173_001694 [Seirophora scorigena]